MLDLENDVKYIKGVGPSKAELLKKIGINNVKDLITYYPRAYEDRSKPKHIAELEDGEQSLIEAMVITRLTEIKAGRLKLYKLTVRDETGTAVITWFNQPYLKTMFKVGQIYNFYGKVSKKGSRIEMNSPVFDKDGISKNTGKIVPIYPLTNGLTQGTIRTIEENALNMLNQKFEESLPEYIINENKLEEINEAVRNIHFPRDFSQFNRARTRLVFEELMGLQLGLLSLKNEYQKNDKKTKYDKNVDINEVIEKLPFELTNAQKKAIKEIIEDMDSNKSMNRLLQGDVGSGKTIVAIIAAYKAVKSGYQMAIMAPTAILATQHLESFENILKQFGIKCELLVSSITKKKKNEILEKLKNGEIDIAIGTHALIEENVVFKKLGLVITDEQHRFGVRQREIIAQKGEEPDVLVMTATPIPRTLALILYGDLDISIMDELPPNRKKIETYAVNKDMEERVNNFIKKQIDSGRQAYIVCPLVEENEEMDMKSVLELEKKYKEDTFKEYRVEYIHGKMRPSDKDEIMQRFKEGKIDILISTTVIEVGVNVPNASIMVVENAERFGLAALHQLRGRVGRGEYQSYCILKYEGKSKVVQERMKIMSSTNDGFIIAEKDLELRGTGDFFGTKQHGLPELKIANLFEDMEILKRVQKIVNKIELEDPKLETEKNIKLKKLVDEKFNLEKINL